MSINFEFLTALYPKYSFYLTKAEECYEEDPHNSIIKIGVVTEDLLKEICIKTNIELGKHISIKYMRDKIRKLKIIAEDRKDLFDVLEKINENRNIAAHNIIFSKDISLGILEQFYLFSTWYYSNFYNNEFIPEKFKYHSSAIDETGNVIKIYKEIEVVEILKETITYLDILKKYSWLVKGSIPILSSLLPYKLMLFGSLGYFVLSGVCSYNKISATKQTIIRIKRIKQIIYTEINKN